MCRAAGLQGWKSSVEVEGHECVDLQNGVYDMSKPRITCHLKTNSALPFQSSEISRAQHFNARVKRLRIKHFISIHEPLPLPHQPHLPLHLVPKIKIPPNKRMHPYIAVLAAARVPPPERVHRHRVQGPKVPLDAPDFVLEDLVVEAGFELALAGGGGGDVHGGLAAAEDHEGFLGRDGGGVEGGVGGVGF